MHPQHQDKRARELSRKAKSRNVTRPVTDYSAVRPRPWNSLDRDGLDCAEQSSAALDSQSFALRNPNRFPCAHLLGRVARSWARNALLRGSEPGKCPHVYESAQRRAAE